MAKDLTVNGTTFSFPEQGENAPWGENITDWASSVTNTLVGFVSDTDISNGSATISNNLTATSIANFSFDISKVRGFVVEYTIYVPSGTIKSETGVLLGNYDGSDWTLVRQATDDVGFTFSITSAGQIQYTFSGTSGVIKYSAKTKQQ